MHPLHHTPSDIPSLSSPETGNGQLRIGPLCPSRNHPTTGAQQHQGLTAIAARVCVVAFISASQTFGQG